MTYQSNSAGVHSTHSVASAGAGGELTNPKPGSPPATLSVSGYVRRKPADPNAEAYERTHARLREEVALMELDREIAEIIRRDVGLGE